MPGVAGLLVTLWGLGCAQPEPSSPPPPGPHTELPPAPKGPLTAAEHGCPVLRVDEPPAAWGQPGHRRLALIVGVGDYLAEGITDLQGPPGDAQRIFELLTQTYGFPMENVCVLIDAQATHAHFEAAWREALVERAAPGDEAVFFFAGHGSQGRDWDANGVDEPDGWDETLMLHDSRVLGNLDLIDDALNAHLAELHARTRAITVLIDACNSGSAARGVEDGLAEGVAIRQFTPLDLPPPQGYDPRVGGDYRPAELPGLVFVSAARDGTSALEVDGHGVFTTALVDSLQQAGASGTWGQLTRSLPRLVAAQGSPQVVTFEGDLERGIFGAPPRERPPGWDVAGVVGDQLSLSGVPLPGWTEGAVIRIYPGDVRAEELSDPERAAAARKGRARVTAATPFGGRAEVLDGAGFTDQDIAMLEAPGQAPPRITLRLQARGPKALEPEQVQAITRGIEANAELSQAVALEPRGAWSLRAGPGGSLQLIGPEGALRNTLAGEDPVAAALHQLALFNRQATLLELAADPAHGDWLEVQVEAIRASQQLLCPKEPFQLAPAGALQEVPLCTGTQVRVTLSEAAPGPRVIGGVRLNNDGSIDGLPARGERVELRPGEQVVLPGVVAQVPPVDAVDTLLIFATEDKVEWTQLEGEVARSVGDDDLDGVGWAVAALPIMGTADPRLWTQAEREDPKVCEGRAARAVSQCAP
ncbi:MAG: caspase family protein [Alphaproteobacteria bacterium]|nr:caspase family protein [Alphaproteobacteria bacterium]